ncbi:MAG TPA: phosphoglycerate kinase [Candidatus Paceibacterota bacterium]|nr:phosphoglycerate kinase [Candidatus Paceibacterota bacterium]
MKTLKEIEDIKDKKIFLRCDFNVPVTDGKIDDDYRIKKALPTIHELREKGAKLILASHIETEGNPTLAPVRDYLSKIFPVDFITDFFPEDIAERVNVLPEGGVILLENLRKYSGEKANDESFAKHLASFADLYVDDAFATAHRPHASIVGVPKFIQGFAGFLLTDEVTRLASAFNAPHPFVFILGGAKFETKLPLVSKFLGEADTLFIGGALANDIYKARGWNVGASKLSKDADVSAFATNEKIAVPMEVVVKASAKQSEKSVKEIGDDEMILDASVKSLELLRQKIADAKFILWNGPLGVFEEGFRESTEALAKMIAESPAESIVGGGDTLSAIQSLHIEDKFSFVSTGGGAMLDFLANGSLPGIDALG